MQRLLKLAGCIALPLLVGFAGSYFTTPEIDGWYAQLEKPDWNPPSAVFGPVWTALYILMGVAWYLALEHSRDQRQRVRINAIFLVQLLLNFAWSFIFFRLHEPGWAFAEIIILWITILITILIFSKSSRIAAWLLVPYISWVSFAAILNGAIWLGNS